ncbi:hypothetical protein N9R73_00460 [Candidatus Pelagibacter sp.]|nr:hypothetical protein [Candidatus Pelagibacter sp.]MDB2446837.1 hypothetical protein [Candidatus Pelagibacter bacterium]
MKTYNIASIEGDGIGKEVVPEAHKVLHGSIVVKHKNRPKSKHPQYNTVTKD